MHTRATMIGVFLCSSILGPLCMSATIFTAHAESEPSQVHHTEVSQDCAPHCAHGEKEDEASDQQSPVSSCATHCLAQAHDLPSALSLSDTDPTTTTAPTLTELTFNNRTSLIPIDGTESPPEDFSVQSIVIRE